MADPANTGIYEIVNLVNGKRYIGSAVRLATRLNQHRNRLDAGRHHNRHLQKSWVKHGPASFKFRAIIICHTCDLLFFEQRAIDLLRSEYNICPTAGSTLGRKFTPEAKAKIAAKATGRKRDKQSVERGAAKLRGVKLPVERTAYLLGNTHALGHKHTDEWKLQNSVRFTGFKRPKSPEYRAKISAALKGIEHSPERRAAQAAGQKGKTRGPYKLDPAKAEQRRLAGKALAAFINAKRWGSREV